MEACQWLRYHLSCNSDITILTDTQTATKALHWVETSSRRIGQCRIALKSRGGTLKVALPWVSGHRNIEGNEQVVGLTGRDTVLGSPLVSTVCVPLQLLSMESIRASSTLLSILKRSCFLASQIILYLLLPLSSDWRTHSSARVLGLSCCSFQSINAISWGPIRLNTALSFSGAERWNYSKCRLWERKMNKFFSWNLLLAIYLSQLVDR